MGAESSTYLAWITLVTPYPLAMFFSPSSVPIRPWNAHEVSTTARGRPVGADPIWRKRKTRALWTLSTVFPEIIWRAFSVGDILTTALRRMARDGYRSATGRTFVGHLYLAAQVWSLRKVDARLRTESKHLLLFLSSLLKVVGSIPICLASCF